MLALWSRASQAPGTCRCLSCISSAPANALSGRRKRPSNFWALHSSRSTSGFPSAFAAAITIDAKAKLERNTQWEEVLSHLREALDRPLQDRRGQQKKTISGDSERSNGNVTAILSGISEPIPEVVQGHNISHAPVQATSEHVQDESQFPETASPEWPASTGRRLVPNSMPPQSLWAPSTTKLSALRRRHTWKKLAMQELSTGLLIIDLVRHVNLAKFCQSAYEVLKNLSPQILEIASWSAERTKVERQRILGSIETLHTMKVNSSVNDIAKAKTNGRQPGIPSYRQDADGDFYEISKQMNDGIKQLLQHVEKGNEREQALVVAKICHNLLVSTASPDLRTFNLLLSGFTLWPMNALVDNVIASLLVSKIRPNENTCSVILEHYTRQNRPDDFSRFVAKMRGVSRGLMLANPTIQINQASEDRLIKDETRGDKIYQKVYPTPLVFATLIDGVMKFAGFDRALDIYYELKIDGWGLPMSGLTKLLGDCVRRADWEGGAYVWEEINSIKIRARHGDMAKAYQNMLCLCSITGNTVAFNQVLNEVVKQGHNRKAIITAAMKTTRWAQHTKTYTAPAWAADNLMIAVSGYVADSKSTDQPEDSFAYDEELTGELTTQSMPQDPSSGHVDHHYTPTSGDQPMNKKEAWSNWVEREFGERPEDPEP